jgi:hypothetical protein
MTALARMLVTFATAASFASDDPVLRLGEMAVETDTRKMKIGDGVTAWTSLNHINGGTDTANTWSGANIFQLDSNANYIVDSKNLHTGTAAAAGFRVSSDVAEMSLLAHASARTVTRCGQVLGGWAELLARLGSGLLINTNAAAPMKFGTNNALALTIDTSQNATFEKALRSIGATSGVGYDTGAGGTVTQLTSKSTGVTLNRACGQITMNNATLNAGVAVTFTLTNSAIAAADLLVLTHAATGTLGNYELDYRCAAGSATIYVRNKTAGNLSEAVVIGFAVIKGVTS